MSRSNIDILVDTEPMAKEISNVSNHVEGTTAAVVSMKMAVLKAENEGTKHICNRVNKGFFTLLHSQISQKIAANKSRTEALLMELNAQKKRLLEIKSTMERDYHRIASRYERIIININKSLKQRVYDLDRPVFNFCEREVAGTNNRLGLLTAIVPVCQLEGVADSQKILASNMKFDSVRAIEATKDFLKQMNEQKLLTRKIQLDCVDNRDAEQTIPVIISVSSLDRSVLDHMSVVLPDNLSQNTQEQITNEIHENASSLSWKEQTINDTVCNEFHRLISESAVSPRVKEMAEKLFDANNTQVL